MDLCFLRRFLFVSAAAPGVTSPETLAVNFLAYRSKYTSVADIWAPKQHESLLVIMNSKRNTCLIYSPDQFWELFFLSFFPHCQRGNSANEIFQSWPTSCTCQFNSFDSKSYSNNIPVKCFILLKNLFLLFTPTLNCLQSAFKIRLGILKHVVNGILIKTVVLPY